MPTLMEMLEAGVHFGHKKERSHPKMKEFTFALREGVFVIDLDKTRDCLKVALDFLNKENSLGKTILFVGTKRQAKEILQKTAEKAGMPYVVKRWLGGTLTNFETVRRSIGEMERLEAQTKTPEFVALTKKEKKIITDKLEKLQGIFTGVKDLKNLPDVVFVIDANREKLAIDEASKMGIPIVAIADTDADPSKITYPIPSNDDATKAIDMIMTEVSNVFSRKSEKTEEKLADEVNKIEEETLEELNETESKEKEEEIIKEKVSKTKTKKPATKKSSQSKTGKKDKK